MDDIKNCVITGLIVFIFTLVLISGCEDFVVVNGRYNGYYVEYKGTVYKLIVPQTAEDSGSGKTQSNTEIPSFLKASVEVDDSQKQR